MPRSMKLSPPLLPTIASLVCLRAVEAWIPASEPHQHFRALASHEDEESKNRRRVSTTAATDRRQLLGSIWRTVATTSAVAVVDIAVASNPGRAWASSDGGDTLEDLACRPGNKMFKRKIMTVRELIEMTVQASSVQAWSSAAESINDTMLDEAKLSSLLLESCASADKKQEAAITEILKGIRIMRSKLANGNEKLATEDAMAVMSLGTTTRSNIDLLFGL